MPRKVLFLALALILGLSLTAQAAEPRLQTPAPSGRLILKFTEESGLVMRPEGLDGGTAADRTRFLSLLADKSGQARLERHFSQDFDQLAQLRRSGQKKVRHSLPDLNTYAELDFSRSGLDRASLLEIVKVLQADPAVEAAFLEPVAVPASLGFDAFTGTYTPPPPPQESDFAPAPVVTGDFRDTPDLISYQGYLGAPPLGVNATAAAAIAGASGAGVSMVDVELGWRLSHEDLPSVFLAAGNTTSTQDNRNHGTAVLGEIAGQDNGLGVLGITPDAAIGVSSAYGASVSQSLLTAWNSIDEGDVILIELHAPGPNATGEGQEGYVPMEYWLNNFDVIQTITANGGVVVEAAGNGGENLDDAVYGSLFDREYRDSGAIMCGAATGSGTPYSWSNHGSRVDLNGWGGLVATCGYGDLHGTLEDEYYTRYFSGTSSASPIVTGAVVALQGMAQANYDITLDALTIRELMASTGTPQNPGINVGPRPDILAAYQGLEWGLGEISGVVTDAETGLPVADVLVAATGTEFATTTDVDGAYALTLPVGMQEITFNQFHYQESSGTREIVFDSPAVLDMALTPWPAVDVHAVVRTEEGLNPPNARLTVLNAPLTAASAADGKGLVLSAAPIGKPLHMRFDGVSGHGVDVVEFIPQASPTGRNYLYPELKVADYDFELWWYYLTALNAEWVWSSPTTLPAAFSGANCWGVGLDGTYPDNGYDLLTSQDMNLYGHETTYLSFHYWCDLEDGVDGVNLQIRGTNNNWITLTPLNGYSHDQVQALSYQPGWSGNSGGWQGAVFDITEYTDLLLAYRFRFQSDGDVNTGGFYIDDITFDHGDSVSPVPGEENGLPPVRAALSVHPNPFNPSTTIEWEITRPGPVAVKVFDPRGHLVRELLNEESAVTSGRVVWDGKDATGQSAASGTYLVQVRDGAGQRSTRAVTLLK